MVDECVDVDETQTQCMMHEQWTHKHWHNRLIDEPEMIKGIQINGCTNKETLNVQQDFFFFFIFFHTYGWFMLHISFISRSNQSSGREQFNVFVPLVCAG